MTRPVPVPDPQSAPFWEAAARHVLCLARCGACGGFSHPPDVVCEHCGSTCPDFTFTPVDGRGTVESWTVMRQSFLPGFEELVPFVLVDVGLSDPSGVRLIGRLLDGQTPRLRLGAPVRTVFEHIRPDIAVPAFTLLEGP
ncbi:Zn-ribbon domain-containing OB-fold protein [Streptomyces sp. NPDC057363]|uniref:Zn-ribbon domain-containing OB-fold protein n=1 Tax=Streptomyces sp. NPDC057363 TaxID=3346107 RepID=UPI00363E04F4